MAYLALNSQFQPFSYSQYMQPVAEATQAQSAVEDKFSDMQNQAQSAKAYLNEQTDPTAYKMYNDYYNQLSSNISNLTDNGLNPNTKQSLLQTRESFNNSILPIELAVSKKQKDVQQQADMYAKDPTMIYQRPANTISVDEYLKDPNLTANGISGNQLTARSAQLSSQLAKLANQPQYKSILGGQFYEKAQQMGYTPTQIMAAVAGNGPKELQQIFGNIWSENNLQQYSPADQERASKFILDGLYGAIGGTSYSEVNNKAWDISANEASQERLAKFKSNLDLQNQMALLGAQQQGQSAASLGGIPINTHSLVSPNLQGANGIAAAKKVEAALGTNMLGGKKATTQYIYQHAAGANNSNAGVVLGTIPYQIWNGDNLKTRSQFIAQGKNANERAILNDKYNEINSSIGNLGLATPDQLAGQGKNWTASALRTPIVNTYKGAAPLQMQTLRMGYKPDESKQNLQNLVSMQEGQNGDLSNIQEVSSFDNQGNLKFAHTRVNKSTFMNDKNEVTTVPQFYASPNPRVNGILFTHLGKTYYVGNNTLGANPDEMNDTMGKLRLLQQKKEELLRNNGKNALNTPYGKQLEGAIDSYGAGFLRQNYSNLGWSAKSPSVDIFTSNQKTEIQ